MEGFKDVDPSKAIPIGEGQKEGFFVPKDHVLVFCFGPSGEFSIIPDQKIGYANGILAAPLAYLQRLRGEGWDFENTMRVENLTVVGHAFVSYTMPHPKWWERRSSVKP